MAGTSKKKKDQKEVAGPSAEAKGHISGSVSGNHIQSISALIGCVFAAPPPNLKDLKAKVPKGSRSCETIAMLRLQRLDQ